MAEPNEISGDVSYITTLEETILAYIKHLKPMLLALAKAFFTVNLEAAIYMLSFVNLITMFSEALGCQSTQTKAQCLAGIKPELELAQLFIIALNSTIATVIGIYWLNHSALRNVKDKPAIKSKLETLDKILNFLISKANESSKEMLKCFLFVFLMVIGFSAFVSILINANDPAKQGNISDALFYGLTTLCFFGIVRGINHTA